LRLLLDEVQRVRDAKQAAKAQSDTETCDEAPARRGEKRAGPGAA
jgi:hypothetical protein